MRFISAETIEQRAIEVLQNTAMWDVPIPVSDIAMCLGLDLEEMELGDEVSGILVVGNGTGAIGYNVIDSPTRQRFTIAHEIGHYILHKEDQELFIDKEYAATFRRDESSASGTNYHEIQANRFAAALLMPRELVISEFENLAFDLGGEETLLELAKRFGVSAQAMSIRLSGLGLLEEAM